MEISDLFKKDLAYLINSHSLENGSDTSDHTIADFLCACLGHYNKAMKTRPEETVTTQITMDLMVHHEKRTNNNTTL